MCQVGRIWVHHTNVEGDLGLGSHNSNVAIQGGYFQVIHVGGAESGFNHAIGIVDVHRRELNIGVNTAFLQRTAAIGVLAGERDDERINLEILQRIERILRLRMIGRKAGDHRVADEFQEMVIGFSVGHDGEVNLVMLDGAKELGAGALPGLNPNARVLIRESLQFLCDQLEIARIRYADRKSVV